MYFESKSAYTEIDLNSSEMSPDTSQTSSLSAGTVLWRSLPFTHSEWHPTEVCHLPTHTWTLLGTTFHSLSR